MDSAPTQSSPALPALKKLPGLVHQVFLNEDHWFEKATQITMKIPNNYYPAKENCFMSVTPESNDILHSLIMFVKITQMCISPETKIVVRYWRGTEDTRKSAYTIAISGIPRMHLDGF